MTDTPVPDTPPAYPQVPQPQHTPQPTTPPTPPPPSGQNYPTLPTQPVPTQGGITPSYPPVSTPQANYPQPAAGYPMASGQMGPQTTTITVPTFDVKTESLAVWRVFSGIFRSQPFESLRTAEQARWFPLIVMITTPLFAGLLAGRLASRTVGDVVSAGESFVRNLSGSEVSTGYELPWGSWFAIWITAIGVTAVLMLLRSVFVHFTFMIHGAKQPFKRSLQTICVGAVPITFVAIFMWIVSLIPSLPLLVIVGTLTLFVTAWLCLVNELVIYSSLSEVPVSRPPLMTHTIFTVVWSLVAALLFGTLILPSVQYMLPSF